MSRPASRSEDVFMRQAEDRLIQLENVVHRALINYSATFLRLSVGAVFLGFGVLKFFPGVSPAESLVIATTDKLTLGLVPGSVALVAVACLECFIGICLLAARWMRLAVWLLVAQGIGILAPLVLLPGRLFSGPHHAPTLEGQYVLKDFILVAAGMVIAALTFRGGRMVRDEPAITPVGDGKDGFAADEKLQIVFAGIRDGDADAVTEICARHGISESTYYEWRDQVVGGAAVALGDPATSSRS